MKIKKTLKLTRKPKLRLMMSLMKTILITLKACRNLRLRKLLKRRMLNLTTRTPRNWNRKRRQKAINRYKWTKKMQTVFQGTYRNRKQLIGATIQLLTRLPSTQLLSLSKASTSLTSWRISILRKQS